MDKTTIPMGITGLWVGMSLISIYVLFGTTDSKIVGQESLTVKSLISNGSLYCQFHSRCFWIIGLLKGT